MCVPTLSVQLLWQSSGGVQGTLRLNVAEHGFLYTDVRFCYPRFCVPLDAPRGCAGKSPQRRSEIGRRRAEWTPVLRKFDVEVHRRCLFKQIRTCSSLCWFQSAAWQDACRCGTLVGGYKSTSVQWHRYWCPCKNCTAKDERCSSLGGTGIPGR